MPYIGQTISYYKITGNLGKGGMVGCIRRRIRTQMKYGTNRQMMSYTVFS